MTRFSEKRLKLSTSVVNVEAYLILSTLLTIRQ